MPELGWMGDVRARRAAGRVAYRLLEVTDTVGDATGACADNLLIQGDNLEAQLRRAINGPSGS